MMSFMRKKRQWTRTAGLTTWLSALAMTVAVSTAPAQTGLYNGDEYTPNDLTSETADFSTSSDISFEATGDTTDTYSDVSFSAAGIYSPAEINLTNTYDINVTGTGGTPAEDADVDANVSVTAVLSETGGDLTNSGDVTVSATGGDTVASATDSDVSANYDDSEYQAGYNEAIGFHIVNGDVTNSGAINVTATSGSASATTASGYDAEAYAVAGSVGIVISIGNLDNSGDITSEAKAAEASAKGDDAMATSQANASGINTNGSGDITAEGEDAVATVTNSGAINVTATSGATTATALSDLAVASSRAEASGISTHAGTSSTDYTIDGDVTNMDSFGDVINTGDVAVEATAGNATADATGTGGKADADAGSQAEGIDAYASVQGDYYGSDSAGNVENSGTVSATANGAVATAYSDNMAEARANTSASGISTYGYIYNYLSTDDAADDGTDAAGNLENSGTVTATANAGTATAAGSADGSTEATDVIATASADAEGLSASGYGYSSNDNDDLDAVGNVENSGNVSAIAAAGTATSTGSFSARSEAMASAYAISASGDGVADADESDAAGNVENSGTVVATATGGTATATGTEGYGTAEASVKAGGISAYGDPDAIDYDVADVEDDDYGTDTYGTVTNTGTVTVTASAGTATASSANEANATAKAEAYGISAEADGLSDIYGSDAFGTVDNSGEVIVSASGTSATATVVGVEDTTTSSLEACAATDTSAVGISTDADIFGLEETFGATEETGGDFGNDAIGSVTNSGNVTVTAESGDATASATTKDTDHTFASASASAEATGIETDGEYGSDSHASVNDIDTIGTVDNSGDITVSAKGGVAEATADNRAEATSKSSASGIIAYGEGNAVEPVDLVGEVTNSGTIIVSAESDTATATATAVSNSNPLADASADGDATASGISSTGDVTNTGYVEVTAQAGMATAKATGYSDDTTQGSSSAEASASAEATGIGPENYYDSYSVDNGVNNFAEVYVSATAAEATATADGMANADATADATGISSVGEVLNKGAVSAIATAANATAESTGLIIGSPGPRTYANAQAYAEGISGENIINYGTVSAEATAADATATATIEDGTTGYYEYITADATADAYGIYGSSSFGKSGIYSSITNFAELTVTAKAGAATATGTTTAATGSYYEVAEADADSFAEGIYAYSGINNSAAVTVSATAGTAEATVPVSDDIYTTDGIEVTTTAEAEASAVAYGLYSYYASLTNSGDVTVSATAGSATAEATDGASATAGARALGLYGSSETAIVNSGTITVTAIGGTAVATTTAIPEFADIDADGEPAAADAYSVAVGIETYGSMVVNSGDIIATATGGSATTTSPDSEAEATTDETEASDDNSINASDLAAGIVAESDAYVENSGNITATVTATEVSTTDETYETDGAWAAGIVFRQGGTLTNTGVLRATGDNAYEVAVDLGTVTLVDTYNMTLDGDPTVGSLWANEEASYNLNNAELSVTLVDGETQWDTEYAIFDTSDGGEVTGAFSGLAQPTNPNVVATYLDQGTTGSADDTVSVSYEPVEGASTFSEGVSLSLAASRMVFNMTGQRQSWGYMGNMLAEANSFPRLYADAGTFMSDAGYGSSSALNGFYLTPFMASVKKDAEPVGYDTDIKGFVMGYDRMFGEKRLGAFFGYSQSELDYAGSWASANSEDQDMFTLGVNGMMPIAKWTLRGQLGGFMTSHDYKGVTGMNLDQVERADYDSNGIGLSLMAGYPLIKGKHLFLPEAGLEMLYASIGGFTTDTEESNWNVSSDSESSSNFAAVLSAKWLTQGEFAGLTMTPSASLGLRQLLSDEAIELEQTIGDSNPYTVESSQNETSVTFAASLKAGGETLSAELGYDGEFGDEATVHNVWLQFYYNF
jgi:hypothetical protein